MKSAAHVLVVAGLALLASAAPAGSAHAQVLETGPTLQQASLSVALDGSDLATAAPPAAEPNLSLAGPRATVALGYAAMMATVAGGAAATMIDALHDEGSQRGMLAATVSVAIMTLGVAIAGHVWIGSVKRRRRAYDERQRGRLRFTGDSLVLPF